MATKKVAVKKPAVKKTAKPVIKKVVAVKKAVAPVVKKAVTPPKKLTAIKTPFTKSQVVQHLSTVTEVKKKDVGLVLDAVAALMEAHLNKKGPGEMNFAGLLKLRVISKPATKAREGKNPFTGEMMTISAKPARRVIKVRPLKKLKEAVG